MVVVVAMMLQVPTQGGAAVTATVGWHRIVTRDVVSAREKK